MTRIPVGARRRTDAAGLSTHRLRGLRHVALLGLAIVLIAAAPGAAQERPSSIAPYRYTSPPIGSADSLERQQAYSYRNQLSAQQRQTQTDRTLNRAPEDNAASRLRSQGELSREGSRIDRVLQR